MLQSATIRAARRATPDPSGRANNIVPHLTLMKTSGRTPMFPLMGSAEDRPGTGRHGPDGFLLES